MPLDESEPEMFHGLRAIQQFSSRHADIFGLWVGSRASVVSAHRVSTGFKHNAWNVPRTLSNPAIFFTPCRYFRTAGR